MQDTNTVTGVSPTRLSPQLICMTEPSYLMRGIPESRQRSNLTSTTSSNPPTLWSLCLGRMFRLITSAMKSGIGRLRSGYNSRIPDLLMTGTFMRVVLGSIYRSDFLRTRRVGNGIVMACALNRVLAQSLRRLRAP